MPASVQRAAIGVDVGGTFTDVIMSGPGGLRVVKVPTSSDQARAVLRGLDLLGGNSKEASLLSHATTLATNALLTKSGLALTAFITNRGFRDVLEIGRQRRPELYNLRTRRPPPLVQRRYRFAVRCRVGADGRVLEPLDTDGAHDVAEEVARSGFESVAVCFLHSYANPSHELAMRDILRQCGFKGNVSLSSEVDREYREYERSSTTVVNAALVPLMSRYLARLVSSLTNIGMNAPIYVMNSDGGMSTSTFASTHPVTAIESGPAAGVLASRRLARSLKLGKVLTFDMGGTTAKAGAVIDGEPEVVEEFEAAGRTHSGRSIKGSGYAVRGSFIDLAEVSAGGGTIAKVDEGGGLVVGPESAGAFPGPACYGIGGKEPTVTDANVTLGRLNPNHLLGGEMRIKSNLAVNSLARLGRGLGMTAIEAAEGIIRLVNNSMSKAISIVSVERGRDPREFTMVSFGGSGPVHSCDLAEDLGIRDLVVPAHAGLFSAYGLLVADLTRTFTEPILGGPKSLIGTFDRLESLASKEMKKEGFLGYSVTKFIEARYEGQSHELLLPYGGSDDLRKAFDRRHRELYGYSTRDRLEVVNARLKATVPRPDVPGLASPQPKGPRGEVMRKAWFAGKATEAPVLSREGLSKGDRGEGPCIIEEYDSTLVVNKGWEWKVDDFGVTLHR